MIRKEAAEVGQKASAKITPIKNAPAIPNRSLSVWSLFAVTPGREKEIRLANTMPIRISAGPR